MNGDHVLLDTNAVIAMIANDRLLLRRLQQVEEMFTSSITLGELYYGAFKSSRITENLERIR
jgi:tRNA(fMet)-specific endonuclease VapC